MAKVKISEFSSTPGNNTDIDGINIAENCPPSGINDAIRELMAQLKDWQSGTSNDPYVVGSSGSLTLSYGTANGVAYLNGSKVLTTGSALTFDGTKQTLTSLANAAPVELLRLSNSGSGDLTQAQITFYAASTNYAVITGGYNGAPSLISNVANTGYQSWQIATNEQMRLTSTGLGIGTSSPTEKLHVTTGTTYAATFNSAVTTATTTRINIGGFTNSAGGAGGSVAIGSAHNHGSTALSSLTLYTHDGSSLVERMRLDSSGNLGLGVTPSAWGSFFKAIRVGTYAAFATNIQNAAAIVASNAYNNDNTNWRYSESGVSAARYEAAVGTHAWFTAPSGTAGNAISFTQAMTLSGATPTILTLKGSTSTNGGAAYYVSRAASSTTLCAFGDASAIVGGAPDSSTLLWSDSGIPLRFFVGNEVARFDTGGNLLVGTTSHSDGSMFQTTGTTPLNSYRATTTPSGGIYGAYSDVGGTKTVRAYFRVDGGLANYSANDVNLSDERLKKDVSLASNYLEKICSIPVKNFRYKDQSEFENITLGVIAQDVLAVAPELVSEEGFGLSDDDKQNYLSVYQTDLQYALMKCIQEQQAIIEDMKTRLAAAGI